ELADAQGLHCAQLAGFAFCVAILVLPHGEPLKLLATDLAIAIAVQTGQLLVAVGVAGSVAEQARTVYASVGFGLDEQSVIGADPFHGDRESVAKEVKKCAVFGVEGMGVWLPAASAGFDTARTNQVEHDGTRV